MKSSCCSTQYCIPDGFIVFISGVPGVGKTTISYELLRRFDVFRLIQETDLMREILRGYNNYLQSTLEKNNPSPDFYVNIYDNKKFLDYNTACEQCNHMKESLYQIIMRQQRKKISTIINGVHIVPEVLSELSTNKNIVFINLYISDETEFIKRFKYRDESKYSVENIKYIFEANKELHRNTLKVKCSSNSAIHSIDIKSLSIKETLDIIIECISQKIKTTV